jgi:hypothetical protein
MTELDNFLQNLYGNQFKNKNYLLRNTFIQSSYHPYINQWILSNGYNYKDDTTLGMLGGINGLLSKGSGKPLSEEEFNKISTEFFEEGYNYGRKGRKGKGGYTDEQIRQAQFEAAKFGFLVPHNLLLTKQGEMYSFSDFAKVSSGEHKLKTLSGETEVPLELRATIAKGLRPKWESESIKRQIDHYKSMGRDINEKLLHEINERAKQITDDYENQLQQSTRKTFNELNRIRQAREEGSTKRSKAAAAILTDEFNFYDRNLVDLQKNLVRYGYRDITSESNTLGFIGTDTKNINEIFNFPGSTSFNVLRKELIVSPLKKVKTSSTSSDVLITPNISSKSSSSSSNPQVMSPISEKEKKVMSLISVKERKRVLIPPKILPKTDSNKSDDDQTLTIKKLSKSVTSPPRKTEFDLEREKKQKEAKKIEEENKQKEDIINKRLEDLRNKKSPTVINAPLAPGSGQLPPPPPPPRSGPPPPPGSGQPPPPGQTGSTLSKEEAALLKKVERLEKSIQKPQVSEMTDNEEKIYKQIQDPEIKDIYQYDMTNDERQAFDALTDNSIKEEYMNLRKKFREEFLDMPKDVKTQAITELTSKQVNKWIKANKDIIEKNRIERLKKLDETKNKTLKAIQKLFDDFDNPKTTSTKEQSTSKTTTEPKSASVVEEIKVKKEIEKLEKFNKRFSTEKKFNLGNLQYNTRYIT